MIINHYLFTKKQKTETNNLIMLLNFFYYLYLIIFLYILKNHPNMFLFINNYHHNIINRDIFSSRIALSLSDKR